MNHDEFTRTLAQLRQNYLQTFTEKRQALDSAWRSAQCGTRGDQAWRDLYTLVHRLVGSAGSYDLSELAHSAARLEKLLDSSDSSPATIEMALVELDQFLAKCHAQST